jgi:DNA-binding transcriptional LysR family regulator
VAEGLDADAYVRWPHANLDTASTRMLDRVLSSRRIQRRTALTVPNFMTAAWIVAETDWLPTLPSNLARHLQRILPLRVLELPFPVPHLTLDQMWHDLCHRDALHLWVRNQIAAVIRENFPSSFLVKEARHVQRQTEPSSAVFMDKPRRRTGGRDRAAS